MRRDNLVEILNRSEGVKAEQGKKDASAFLLDPSTEATLYAGIGGELLTVGKIVRIELTEQLAMTENQKGERIYLETESIKAVKFEKIPEIRREGRAGFSR